MHSNLDFTPDSSKLFPSWFESRTSEEIIALSDLNKLYRQKLSWGVEIIDQALGGGLLSGMIYEISGESGSGKTQAGLTLASQVLITRMKDSEDNHYYILYIFTSGVFPVVRLKEILENRLENYNLIDTQINTDDSHNNSRKLYVKQLLDHVLIEKINTQEELWDVFEKKFPKILQNYQIRLIVIDSIAQLFRTDDDIKGKGRFSFRSSLLFRLSSFLKRIASEFQAWIVVINEVSDVLENQNSIIKSEQKLRPSLGLSWSNCIDSRIVLSKFKNSIYNEKNARLFELIFAPNTPPCLVPFMINEQGITRLITIK